MLTVRFIYGISATTRMQRIDLPLAVTAKARVILELDEYVSGAPYCQSLQGEIASPDIDVQGLTGWFNIGDLRSRYQKAGNMIHSAKEITTLILNHKKPENTLLLI